MLPLQDIIRELEHLAPPKLQESYDNSGLITGDLSMKITSALICLDSTEAVIDEAIRRGCNLVIAHHPIVFSGLKKITGSTYIERVIIKAIQNNIAIYAIHTNLDNVAQGVNSKICDRLGLQNTRILAPLGNQLKKLVTFAPIAASAAVKNAIFNAGAGHIGNYSECSFSVSGEGSFKGNEASDPHVGKKGERHLEKEERIEVIFPSWKEAAILSAMKDAHPYEEVAYDVYSLTNLHPRIGAGMVGELEKPLKTEAFLDLIKEKMNAKVIRHTALIKKDIKTVAVCGGSGSFLLNEAKRANADIFISADFKYHQFFDAEDKIIIADIGHFETEQFTIDLLGDYLREKFTTFAVLFTETNTNPIYYH
jgi:dinuclear metal center YbgI/SA1388 family protein